MTAASLARQYGVTFLLTLVMSCALAYVFALGALNGLDGVLAALALGTGFVVTSVGTICLFERQAGALFAINVGYRLVLMVAVLTRLLGRSRWEVAEEIVQETLIKALQVWSMHGTPERPGAWLMTVAKNKAVDWLRKEARTDKALAALEREASAGADRPELPVPSAEDDQLRMLLACCDPRMSPPDRVALTLKAVCGLSHEEIAAALLLPEETVRKRLYRAKEFLKAQGDFPTDSNTNLPIRFESVLEVLYLMFNEGYKATSHASLIRFELCEEALRVCWKLRRNPSAPSSSFSIKTGLCGTEIG